MENLSEELQKIYDLLDSSFQSTNTIAKKARLNWYRVDNSLRELVRLNLAETLELPKLKCWRRK